MDEGYTLRDYKPLPKYSPSPFFCFPLPPPSFIFLSFSLSLAVSSIFLSTYLFSYSIYIYYLSVYLWFSVINKKRFAQLPLTVYVHLCVHISHFELLLILFDIFFIYFDILIRHSVVIFVCL